MHLLTTGYPQLIEALMALFATPKALDRLHDRLRLAEDDVADLKRASRKLDLEFTELYDKVSHQLGRMAKRYAARAAADTPDLNDEPVPEALTREQTISQSIMLRRGMKGAQT